MKVLDLRFPKRKVDLATATFCTVQGIRCKPLWFSQDENDPKKLLAAENINRKALEQYAVEATAFATDGALSNMEFEKNHRGENDVALFDFTSLFASENAARIIERKGKRILLCVAGDSLLEVSTRTCTCTYPSSCLQLPHISSVQDKTLVLTYVHVHQHELSYSIKGYNYYLCCTVFERK